MSLKRGDGMDAVLFLFVVGLILAIGGIYFYSKSNDDGYASLREDVKAFEASSLKLMTAVENLDSEIKKIDEAIKDSSAQCNMAIVEAAAEGKKRDGLVEVTLKKLTEDAHIMSVRQTSMDKKVAETVKEIEARVNSIVQVAIVSWPRKTKEVSKPVPGQGAKSLLERSGVKKENGAHP